MTKDQIIERLTKANEAYRTGEPIMSDHDYDELVDQLRAIEPNHPLVAEIDDCDRGFGSEAKHAFMFGSQDKAMSVEEMDSFYRRTYPIVEYVASDKLDGMSMELVYRDGVFVEAITRGDGITGVVVTSIVREIPSVPKRLPMPISCSVRGEVMIDKPQFTILNDALIKDGRPPMRTTRNGAVGIVKSKDNAKYARFLSFRAFDIQDGRD